MRGETRRKARRRYPGDEALRRVSPRRRRERRRRERERGRDPEHRAELPRVPSAATVGANAERTEAGGGELCRTRPRRRICIRRAGRRTHKSTALHREHGCPDRDRMLEGKPPQGGNESANYSAKQISTGSKIEPNTTHKLQVLSKSNGSLRLAPGRSATKRGSARPPMRSAQ